jgi:hypothetical protein
MADNAKLRAFDVTATRGPILRRKPRWDRGLPAWCPAVFRLCRAGPVAITLGTRGVAEGWRHT